LVALFVLACAASLLYYFLDSQAWLVNLFAGAIVSVVVDRIIGAALKPDPTVTLFHPGSMIAWIFVQSYLKEPSSERLSRMSCVMWALYFRASPFKRKIIEQATPAVAAGLILAMQGRRDLVAEAGLNFSHLKELARRAAKWELYRKYLLQRAASELPAIHRRARECAGVDDYVIGDDLRLVSDAALTERIGASRSETVHLFATTAQLSRDFIHGLKAVMDKIEKVNFYICSPLVISHGTLLGLDSEYENPEFCINPSQVVLDDEGKVNQEADHIRRAISVLAAMEEILALAGAARLRIKLFTKHYPGVKIRLLERNSYIQIQPGSLSYQNNLYRFGLDSDSGTFVREVVGDLQRLAADGFVESVPAAREALDELRHLAVNELAVHLIARGISAELLAKTIPRISARVRSPLSDRFLADLFARLGAFESTVRSTDRLATIPLLQRPAHISVGMVVIREDQILLIKKADNFYQGKYSIVAGHVEVGEGPCEALSRESKEELGILPASSSLACAPFLLDDECRHGSSDHIWFVFACTLGQECITADRSEISKLEWVPLGQLHKWQERLTDGAIGVLKAIGRL